MCGRATLAMVVSSTCSSTAIITPMVTMIRSPEGSGCVATWAGVSSAIFGLLLRLVFELDRGGHRKAGDHRTRKRAIKDDAHGYPLRDLDPIAVRVLGREQRELATRSRADALHVTLELLSTISVDLHGRALARRHAREVLFLEVRFDPGRRAVDDRDHAHAGHRHLSDLQVVGILDHAIHWR